MSNVRRSAFDQLLKLGIQVNGRAYLLSQEVYEKLFTENFSNSMPDDLYDALRYEHFDSLDARTRRYQNVYTGLILLVDTEKFLVVGIAVKGMWNEAACIPCQNRKSTLIYKAGFLIRKGSGNSDGDDDDIPKCLPADYDPSSDGYQWRGNGTVESNHCNWVHPETGAWLHNDLDHGPPIGGHWDFKTPNMSEKVRVPTCEE